MKKTSKILAVLLSLALLISLLPITAKATVSTDITFDAEFYLNKYSDLRAAFGNDYDAAYNHFLTYGIKEGRQASPIFDVVYYLNQYKDLQVAFGNNYESAYNHFLTYGIKEGRRSSYEFDVVYYLSQYEDLQAAFGSNYASAYNHFLTYGMREGRDSSEDFCVTCYINGYGDLKAAYGTTWKLGFEHYYLYGQTEGRHTTHSVITTEAVDATCTTNGYTESSYCEYCGEVYVESEEIVATGHDMTKVEAIDATCTENGNIEYYVCANEDGVYYVDEDGTETYSEEEIVIETTGHSYESEVTTEATCTETGVTTYTCSVCGDTYTEEIAATGHDMTKVEAIDATCTENGNIEYYVCANEDGVYYVDGDGTETYSEEEIIIKASHTWDEGTIIVESTCTETGTIEYICTVCGETKTEEIEATGHDMTEVAEVSATCTETGTKAYYVCANEEEEIYYADEDGTEIYSEEDLIIEATGHNIVEVADEDRTTVAATCTESGYDEYYCTYCGTVYLTEVSALGHSFEEYVGTTASCTESGVETYKCIRCDETEEVEVEASHTVEEWTIVEATCTTEGYKAGICTVCGEAVTEVIEMIDHTWDSGEVTIEPTCTETGLMTYTCEVCGEESLAIISATGHDMTKIEAVDATCEEDGNIEYYVCADEPGIYYVDEEGTATYTEEEIVIEATGHDITTVQGYSATCTTDGMRTYYVCANEPGVYYANSGLTATYTEDGLVIEATGHNISKVEAIEATCTTDGNVEYYVCANEEGVYYADEDLTETLDEVVIEATGHSMTRVKAVPATCEEEGNVEYYICANEEGVYYADEEGTTTYTEDELIVPVIDHSYTIEVDVTTLGDYTAPTCTEDGYVAYQCDMCGNIVITSASATGHSYVSETTVEPTCTDTGIMKYTCETCGDSYEVVILATGHNMIKVDAVDASCTETGTIEYYVCSEEDGIYYADEDGTATYSEEDLIVEATGHTLRLISYQGTYYEDGEETTGRLYYSICTVCQEEWWYVDSSYEEEALVIKVTTEEGLSEAIETVTSDTDNSYVIVIESDLETENEIDISEVTVFVISGATFTNGTVSE